jgi:hypothetical protein
MAKIVFVEPTGARRMMMMIASHPLTDSTEIFECTG